MEPSLHVEVAPGEGPYALMVHGVLSSRAHWLPNLDALAAVCRPVVVELWGHGRSPSPTDPARYAPERYAQDFDAIRASLGAERWFVIGHSLGAALTLRYVVRRPEHVIAHVFTNSNSALAEAGWMERARPVIEAQAADMRQRGSAALNEHPLHPGRAGHIPPAVKQALVNDVATHDPEGMAMTMTNTVLASPVRDLIAANARPALLTVGTREASFRAGRDYAAEVMPHLEIVELNAGHAVNLQDAAGFNRAVVDFFARSA